jgi:hypothetical protein
MSKASNFFLYNNIVPITISAVLLGTSATYAANNPEVFYEATETVIAIDNTYIAAVDFDTFSPTIEILSVTEDELNYYASYRFITIELVEAVWQNVSRVAELVVPKANLGGYRDLGLYLTQELHEKVMAEEKRLRDTQVFERQNVTRKQVATAFSGIIGGLLTDEVREIDGYNPLLTPPQAAAERQTFARPDETSTVSKPIALQPAVMMPPPTTVVMPEPATDVVPPATTSTVPTVIPAPTPASTPVPAGATTTSPPPTSTSPLPATTTTSGGGGGGGVTTPTPPAPVNTAPVLTLIGDNPVALLVGASYTDLGVVATDNGDAPLVQELQLDGVVVSSISLSTATPRVYTITYRATDSGGLSTTVERVVRVEAVVVAPAPAPTPVPTPTATATTPTAPPVVPAPAAAPAVAPAPVPLPVAVPTSPTSTPTPAPTPAPDSSTPPTASS